MNSINLSFVCVDNSEKMPGSKKKSREERLHSREKRFFRRKQMTEEELRLESLRNELRNPNRQDITDTAGLSGNTGSESTDATRLPSDDETTPAPASDSDDDFVTATQGPLKEQDGEGRSVHRQENTSASRDKPLPADSNQPGTSQGSPRRGKCDAMLVISGWIVKFTVTYVSVVQTRSYEVNVKQHPEETNGKTLFAVPVHIQLPNVRLPSDPNDPNEVDGVAYALGQVRITFHVQVHSTCRQEHDNQS